MTKEFAQFRHALRLRLSQPLPGSHTHLNMAPSARAVADALSVRGKSCREAAVIALIYPDRDGPSLLLTLRRSDLADHPGQISFPGGSRDAGEDLVETALREAREELGVSPEDVDVLGPLTPLFIPPSGFCVYPFVATVDRLRDLSPNPDEVEAVLRVPLSHFLEENIRVTEEWVLRGEPVTVPFYAYETHKVWGATAMILSELLELVREV